MNNALETGIAQYTFGYGEPHAGWDPIVGDWNGGRHADVGLYDAPSGTFYLTDRLESGPAQYVFGFGDPTRRWQPVAGDWNADGRAGAGLYDPRASTFYLTNTLTGGYADTTLGFGPPRSGWLALAGCWTTEDSPPASNGQAVDQLDLPDLAAATLNDLDSIAL